MISISSFLLHVYLLLHVQIESSIRLELRLDLGTCLSNTVWQRWWFGTSCARSLDFLVFPWNSWNVAYWNVPSKIPATTQREAKATERSHVELPARREPPWTADLVKTGDNCSPSQHPIGISWKSLNKSLDEYCQFMEVWYRTNSCKPQSLGRLTMQSSEPQQSLLAKCLLSLTTIFLVPNWVY